MSTPSHDWRRWLSSTFGNKKRRPITRNPKAKSLRVTQLEDRFVPTGLVPFPTIFQPEIALDVPIDTEGQSVRAGEIVLQFQDTVGAADLTHLTAHITWGDGSTIDDVTSDSTSIAQIVSAGGNLFNVVTLASGSHTFEEAAAGSLFSVNITDDGILDSPAGSTGASTPLNDGLGVADIPVTLSNPTNTTAIVNEGDTTDALGVVVITDPGNVSGQDPQNPGPLFFDADQTSDTPEYSVTIDWGDGQTTTVDSFNNPEAFTLVSHDDTGTVYSIAVPHAYEEEDSGSSVSVSVVHENLAPVTLDDTLNVTVLEVDPVVNEDSGGTLTPINEGQSTPAGLAIGTFTDTGNPDGSFDDDQTSLAPEYSVTIDWGDNSTTVLNSFDNPEAFSFDASTRTFTILAPAHTYVEESTNNDGGSGDVSDGNYHITMTVDHEDADEAGPTEVATILVNDPPVVLSPVADLPTINEGQTVTNATVATFSDPGGSEGLDAYAATIDWGDGTTTPGVISPFVGTSLLTNGDFELPEGAGQNSSIPGWTLQEGTGGGSIEIGNFQSAFDGNQFVELNSFSPSTISQDVTTVVGQTYQLSFAFSARVDTSLIDNDVAVSINGTPITVVTADGSELEDSDWTVYTFNYTATSTTSTIQFASLSPQGDGVGGLIDGVTFAPSGFSVTGTHTYAEESTHNDSGPGNINGVFQINTTIVHDGNVTTGPTQTTQIEVDDPPVVFVPTAAAIPVFGTGLDAGGNPVAAGTTDPHYTVNFNGGGAAPAVEVTDPASLGWQGGTATSQWISLDTDGAPDSDGTLDFQTTFDLSNFDSLTAILQLQVSADDEVLEIDLNGVNTGISLPDVNSSPWTFFSSATISSGFVPGINTLDFIVPNSGGPGGLQVQLTGTAIPSTFIPAILPTINEGDTVTDVQVAAFTDPGGPEDVSDYAATIDWGDGTTPTTGTITAITSSIDTTADPSITDGESPFGVGAEVTATYGETITATASQSVLTSFSFQMNLPSTVAFRGEVYAWNGTNATGAGLFESAPMSTSGTGVETVTFIIPGGVTLTPGQQYVLFATTSKDQAGHSGEGSWPRTINSDAYSGGNFVYYNNGSDFGALTSTPWDGIGINSDDFAFTAVFFSSFTVTGTHTYAEESVDQPGGVYPITTTVVHDGDVITGPTQTAAITVNEVQLTNFFLNEGIPTNPDEGSTLDTNAIAFFTDPAGPESVDDYTATIDWGDGSGAHAGTVVDDGGGNFEIQDPLGHKFGEEGDSFTLTVTVKHESAPLLTDTLDYTVQEVALTNFTIAFDPANPPTEGTTVGPFQIGTFTDPGGAESIIGDPSPIALPGISNWYKGENNANDSVGGNDGSLVGNVNFVPGAVGQAFSFDGSTGSYVDLGTGASINGDGDFTVSAIIKTTTGGMIIQQRDDNNINGEYLFSVGGGGGAFVSAPGKLAFEENTDALGVQSFVSNADVNDGNYHYVVAVRHASGTVDLYIDGVLDSSTPGTPVPLDPTINSFIGEDERDDSNQFIGVIDEVQIYNGTALTAAQVLAGMSPSYTATINWGDGSPTVNAIITNVGGNDFAINAPTHLFVEEGNYTITVTLNHEEAQPQALSLDYYVIDPPVILTAGPDINPAENQNSALVILGTFTDPGNIGQTALEPIGEYDATVDWGDGTTDNTTDAAPKIFIIQPNPAVNLYYVIGEHTYAEELAAPGYKITTTVHHHAEGPSLVVNGGFESGDLSGWDTTGDVDIDDVNFAHTGLFSSFASNGSWSQSVPTVPGQQYTFSFWEWVQDDSEGEGNDDGATDFQASWNGTQIFDTTASAFNYSFHTFTVTATADNTLISFQFTSSVEEEEDPSFFVDIDDVIVAPTTDVDTTVSTQFAIVSDQPLTNLTAANLPSTSVEGASVGPIAGIATFVDPAGGESVDPPVSVDFSTFSSGTTPVVPGVTFSLIGGQTEGGGDPTTDGSGLTNSDTGGFPTAEILDFNFTQPESNVSFTIDNEGSEDEGAGETFYSAFDASGNLLETNFIGGGGTFTLSSTGVKDLQINNNSGGESSWIFSVSALSFGSPPNYTATINWGDGTTSPGTIHAAVPVTVSVFSGISDSSTGAPYSGLLGTFTSSDIQFETDTGNNWLPFGLTSDQAFGADITGSLSVASDGDYTFSLNSDDGSALFIDGNQVIDNGGDHGPTLVPGTVTLTAGIHTFEVQYYQGGGGSGVDLNLPAGVTYAAGGGNTFIVDAPSHVYAEEGTYAVTTTIYHDALPGATTPSQTIVVSDPSVILSGSFSFSAVQDALASSQVVATFTDPGSPGVGADEGEGAGSSDGEDVSEYAATIDWGDGNFSTGTIINEGDQFVVYGEHLYSQEGSYPIVVTVNHGTSVPAVQQTATATVVNPSVSSLGGFSVNGVEGSSVNSQTVAVFTDPGGATDPEVFTADIDWGDGNGFQIGAGNITYNAGWFTVTGAGVTYDEEGTYAIQVRINHSGNPDASPVIVSDTALISDAALTMTGLTPPASPVEGAAIAPYAVATFTDADPNGVVTDYTATVVWGDGKVDTITSAGGGITKSGSTFTVHDGHTYLEEGTTSVPFSVTIVDEGGASATTTASLVTVADAALTMVSVNAPPTTPVEGAPVATYAVATFTDANPGGDVTDFTATIAWGDGTTSTVTSANSGITKSGSTFTVHAGHTYAKYATGLTLRVTVVDHPSLATGTATVNVNDAAIAITNITAPAAVEGINTGLVTVAKFTDADPAATATFYSATISWGDGTSGSGIIVNNGDGTFSVKGSHTFAEEATGLTLTVTVTDLGGGSNPATTTFNVADAPLSGTLLPPSPMEGVPLTNVVVYHFTDADPNGAVGDYTATVTWGDGSVETSGISPNVTIVASTGGGFDVVGSHTYDVDAAGLTFSVSVTDNPSTVSGSATIVVGDQQLTNLTIGTLPSGLEGALVGPISGIATFTDPAGVGEEDPNTDGSVATVNWGDGTITPATIVAGATSGTFRVNDPVGHIYAEEGGYTITVSVKHGSLTPVTVSGTIIVADQQITNVTVTPPAGVLMGVATATGVPVATFIDPAGAEPVSAYTATINWGDGTFPVVGSIVPTIGNGFKVIAPSHTYADAGPHTLIVTVTHESLAPVVSTGTVVVTEPFFVVGPGAGGGSEVRVISATSGAVLRTILPFGPDWDSSISVAQGDLDGDGIDEIIVGAGPGGAPQVEVYSFKTGALLDSFYAYSSNFRSGVNVGAGDVNGDGHADIITGAGTGGGGPHVKAFSGKDVNVVLASFYAYAANFDGGVRVAAGDIDGDGKAEIVTGAGGGGSSNVEVWSLANVNAPIYSYFAYDAGLRDGVFVSVGDVDGDGKADIITGAGGGGSSHVKVFKGTDLSQIRSFFAFPPNGRDGVSVGYIHRADGHSDILAGTPRYVPAQAKLFDTATSQEDAVDTAFDVGFIGGVNVG